MKIIRISNESHAEFKKLCKTQKLTLNQGAEKLIQNALKNGTVAEPPKSVFKKLREIENLFRSWMKTQEKVHLDRLGEDLLSLSRNLNDLGTREDMYHVVDTYFTKLQKIITQSLQDLDKDNKKLIKDYRDLLEQDNVYKQRLMEQLKMAGVYIFIGFCVLATSLLVINLYG